MQYALAIPYRPEEHGPTMPLTDFVEVPEGDPEQIRQALIELWKKVFRFDNLEPIDFDLKSWDELEITGITNESRYGDLQIGEGSYYLILQFVDMRKLRQWTLQTLGRCCRSDPNSIDENDDSEE